jgi:hypothetical protein
MKAAWGAFMMTSSYEASGIPARVAARAMAPATLKSTGWMTIASTPWVMTFSACATWAPASFSALWNSTLNPAASAVLRKKGTSACR